MGAVMLREHFSECIGHEYPLAAKMLTRMNYGATFDRINIILSLLTNYLMKSYKFSALRI